jgi:hypothetical protein
MKDMSGELGFINKRAASWWRLRELLDPANKPTLALPPDDELTGDLTSPKWRITSTGKIQIEAKEEAKKRIGRSPDAGDAVVYAVWSEYASPVAGAFLNYNINDGRGRGVVR